MKKTQVKYMQITAGRGPVECARVVALVMKEFQRYFAENGYSDALTLELVDSEPHNIVNGCYMSATLAISGAEIPNKLIQEWEGSVLWVAAKNPFRPNHKRKNWFVGVKFFDRVELPDIKESDIAYETCRSGGKGGQNVNKVETSVRATHIPSGVSVKCSEERSQPQNKERARERLLLKLRQRNDDALADAKFSQWSSHDNLFRGNPIKKFSGAL